MAADVSSVVRVVRVYEEEGEGKKKRDLITRDLLGSKELDPELQVPEGWDLLSGKTYLEKAKPGSDPVPHQLQDLNLLPEDSAALDLKLVSPSAAACGYQSVCTIEKVKSALARAERESRGAWLKRSDGSSPSPSSSTTSSSVKRRTLDDEGAEESSPSSLVAAGCPSCLLYVLIARGNPRCPRCDSHVPLPAPPKRARIDLNSAHT